MYADVVGSIILMAIIFQAFLCWRNHLHIFEWLYWKINTMYELIHNKWSYSFIVFGIGKIKWVFHIRKANAIVVPIFCLKFIIFIGLSSFLHCYSSIHTYIVAHIQRSVIFGSIVKIVSNNSIVQNWLMIRILKIVMIVKSQNWILRPCQ